MQFEEKILNAKILIVDDQEINIRILQEMFRRAGFKHITTLTDPRFAVSTYFDIKPDLLVLDLNMPKMDGFAVMSELTRANKKNDYLPILILSNSDEQEARHLALQSGAKDFLTKPYDRIEILNRIRNLLEVRMLHNEVKQQNQLLEQKVQERTKELYQAQVDVIDRLSRAIEYRDNETGMHIIRMSQYAEALARAAGVDGQECEMLLRAAPLHDIGKIGIPDSILRKPGKLTPAEFEVMKTHTTIGAELLSGKNSAFMMMAREIALTHHEKWNGSGYPNGLKEETIPLIGRICCLVDVFDALTTERPYKKAWSVEEALNEIKKQSGFYFDPKLVDVFLGVFHTIEKIRQQHIDPKLPSETLWER